MCDECTDTDEDGYGNPGFPNNTCDEDNCPYDYNPYQEDVGDNDGVGDVCDNCPTIPNGPEGGTCICGGAPCMSDEECECGTCSMNQKDTDGDEIGDVCDSTPYADLCQSYCNLCKCCADLQDTGREVDYNVCKNIETNDAGECDNAGCYWRADKEACMTDICISENSGDGMVSAADYAALKKEYLRTGCSGGGSDLCESYSCLYNYCLGMDATNREVDYYNVCKKSPCKDSEGDCNTCGCYWRADNEACMTDICISENSGDGMVSAADYAALKKEYLRTGCPCNP